MGSESSKCKSSEGASVPRSVDSCTCSCGEAVFAQYADQVRVVNMKWMIVPIADMSSFKRGTIKTAQGAGIVAGAFVWPLLLVTAQPRLQQDPSHDVVEFKYECGRCSGTGYVTLEGHDKPEEP